MNSQASIYIPRMSFGWSEEDIREIMGIHRIGTVIYVDFTPLNKKPGFVENIDCALKSAFVHFSNPVFGRSDESPFERYHFRHNYLGNKGFWDTIDNGKSYKIKIASGEYWMCLKNKNPVQRSLMNIHQVVENGRHLENLVKEQAKQIRNLEQKLNGVVDTVYQLLGGLYCQRTQGEILSVQTKMLLGKQSCGDEDEEEYTKGDESKWTIWPTTRQGDSNEKRITELENLVKSHIDKCDYADAHIWSDEFERRMKEDEEAMLEDKWEEQQQEAWADYAASVNEGW